jgi:DNA-binding LytR/AlgR family response regulator
VKKTLAAIEEKIGNDAFIRVHRSYIVNINWIRDIDDSSLVINGKLIPISRNNRQTLMNKLNLLK